MKLLKNGFAFVIELPTIALTIAAYAGAFKAEPKKITQGMCDSKTFNTDLMLRYILTPGCNVIDPCLDNMPVGELVGFQNGYEPFKCEEGAIFCYASLGSPKNFCPSTGEREVLGYICGLPE